MPIEGQGETIHAMGTTAGAFVDVERKFGLHQFCQAPFLAIAGGPLVIRGMISRQGHNRPAIFAFHVSRNIEFDLANVVRNLVLFPIGHHFFVELQAGIREIAHPLVIVSLPGERAPFQKCSHTPSAGFFIQHVPFDEVPTLHFTATQGIFDRGDVFVAGSHQEFPLIGESTMNNLPGSLVFHVQTPLFQREIEGVVKLLEKFGIRGKLARFLRGFGRISGRARHGRTGTAAPGQNARDKKGDQDEGKTRIFGHDRKFGRRGFKGTQLYPASF